MCPSPPAIYTYCPTLSLHAALPIYTRFLWTTSLTGAPGRIVIVGWILRLRWVIWSPARETLFCVDRRIAWTRSLWPDNASSELTPSKVESRSEEHTSELQSLMRIAYAVFCLKNKNNECDKRW